MRLIDADVLKKKAQWMEIPGWRGVNFDVKAVSVSSIDLAPTIEAEPVKHGDWELRHVGHGHYWECSVCHKNPCIYVTKDTKFCPNCGARMDGDRE